MTAPPAATSAAATAADARPASRWRAPASLVAALLLAACGGGGGGGGTGGTDTAVSVQPTAAEASRFLAQATFGPGEASVSALSRQSYGAWLDDQFRQPQTLHRATLDARAAELAVTGATLNNSHLLESFWQQAVTGPDALRQRVAWALSQIFVVSSADSTVAQYPRGLASWQDMLGARAFGTYRELIEAVAMHPMMGLYLSHLRNQKEDPATGRVPDENFAREVMQLFSIGLVELDPQGRPRIGPDGKPLETYTSADIQGLARVFTGFSWYAGPNAADRTRSRFFGGSPHPDRDWQPMQAYPEFHSTAEKRFLGAVVPAQSAPDPAASLKVALDTLAAHPNVGPFLGRQLIQRLVKSNPSPEYVGRVAAAFADNGAGVRGDLKAVIRAVLLDPEARTVTAGDDAAGRLREPVLRLAAFLRAFDATSRSGRYSGIDNTDDPATRLGQTPLRSPSVFNFYRPGYVPPGTTLASRGLVAPELQIAHEVSVAGYLNYLQGWVRLDPASSRDIQPDYTRAMALADQPSAAAPTDLVERMNLLLLGGRMSDGLRAAVLAGVAGRTIPAAVRDASGTVTNQAAIDSARRDRVAIAAFLTLAAPEFLAPP